MLNTDKPDTTSNSAPHNAVEALLEKRTREIVDSAISAGAEDAEAYATHTESIAVRFEKGDLKLTQVDEGSAFGLRALHERRFGFSSTNQDNAAARAELGKSALELALLTKPDEHNSLPSSRPLPAAESLVHPSLADIGIDQAVRHASDLVQRTLAIDPRLSLDRASLQVQRVSVGVASSKGVCATESDALISLSLFGMAVDGDDVGGFDYWGGFVRDTANLEASLEEVAQRFAAGALGNLGAGAGESYKGRVLFSPVALQSIFISPLISALSAIAVQRGRSAMADKIGQLIASAELSIHDDPTDRSLSGACSFDREGQPTERRSLVEQGVLQTYLYNAYAAAVDGRESTGHASGGARSAPGLALHSLVVDPGSAGSPEDLMRSLGSGLLVQRFSGSVDPASGDFSGVAKSARWIDGGQVVRPVRETLISGNAFELLRGDLQLSSTSENIMGGSRAPWALIDGLSVTAG